MINNTFKVKPFVKWVGGKRGIMPELIKRIPKDFKQYYEPFVGGGALYYEMSSRPNIAYLSDINFPLIACYNNIKYNLQSLLEKLKEHKEKHNDEYYYIARASQDNFSKAGTVENSALFIYLMSTCFNGLYRTNKKGEFNATSGKCKNPKIFDEENLKRISYLLKYADISHKDFMKITPEKGDFVYFDPPYHNTTVKYTNDGFSENDQIRLRDFAIELSKLGVNIMISNADTDFINKIYAPFKIEKILAPRCFNRTKAYEVLITNY